SSWVKCLRSKDEAPDFIIKFLKMIQVRLKVGISHETSVACSPQQNSPQQNSVVERRNRTLIEAARTMLIYAKLRYFYGQRLWQPLVIPKIDPLFDFSSSGPALNEMTPATISSGLVRKSSSSTPYVPPSRNDWDLLFQPIVDPQAPEVIAPIAEVIPLVQVESTSLPSLATVDQDAPSPSKSQTTPETQSSVIPQDVEEDIHDI
nr:hypothetical protein [Tanacetum cinerariifolium]